MRGDYESAGDYLRQAGDAYGSYGGQTGLWYVWSIRVLEAKLAVRRGATDDALRLANEIARDGAPCPNPSRQSSLRAKPCWPAAARQRESARLIDIGSRIDARVIPGAWGEYLRLRGSIHAAADIGPRRITTSPRARASSR